MYYAVPAAMMGAERNEAECPPAIPFLFSSIPSY
jgi:hypothetical protein